MAKHSRAIDQNETDVPTDRDVALIPEREAGIEAAIRSADAGRSIPWSTVKAELAVKLATYRDR